ncbi:MAG: hypothetical protein JWO87_3174, partial [Phycisphaerales bacterium]|nr:hypothetical protein [Phycisphaerales bacterium]
MLIVFSVSFVVSVLFVRCFITSLAYLASWREYFMSGRAQFVMGAHTNVSRFTLTPALSLKRGGSVSQNSNLLPANRLSISP